MGGAAPRYPNGHIPDHELVLIEGNHKATRGTAARWEAMKADVEENEGVTLRITGGENAYRSYSGQQFARRNACARGRCNDAAVPGNSSHGGSLNGRDSGAIDVDNWAELGKTKFYEYCRKHGFEPGYFDWEPWHIIDWAPYTVPEPEEDEMSAKAESQINSIFNAVFRGGDSMEDDKASISKSLGRIAKNSAAAADYTKSIQIGGKQESMRQVIADTRLATIRSEARETAMLAAMQSLATMKGADPKAVEAIVERAVKNAMKDVSFTTNIDGE